MKYFYSFLFLLVIQWGIYKVSSAPIGSDINKCVGGELVQYAHHYECVCFPDHVHKDLVTCVKKDTLVKCGPKDATGKACGAFATCDTFKDPSKPDEEKTVCKCLEGYSSDEKTEDHLDKCQATVCKDTECSSGKCVPVSATSRGCSCHIGYIFDDKKKCTVKAKNPQNCKLECGDKQECLLHNNEYYKCACEDGSDITKGECGSAFTSSLSTVNALLLIAVLAISLKMA